VPLVFEWDGRKARRNLEKHGVSNGDNMKKAKISRERTMRKEYDFSKGVRGKYAKRYATGGNLIVLDPDVARIFPDSESVNRALRSIAGAAKSKRGKKSA